MLDTHRLKNYLCKRKTEEGSSMTYMLESLFVYNETKNYLTY